MSKEAEKRWIDLVRFYFPDATYEEAQHILWMKTDFPVKGFDVVSRQLWERAVSHGIAREIAVKVDNEITALNHVHERAWKYRCEIAEMEAAHLRKELEKLRVTIAVNVRCPECGYALGENWRKEDDRIICDDCAGDDYFGLSV